VPEDEQNFLWVFSDEKGFVKGFTRYGFNIADWVLAAISEEVGVEIVSEHAPRYWGYETQEEWNAAQDRFDEECKREEHEEHFWNELVKFARGEIARIKLSVADTAEVAKAEIAKQIVERVVGDLPELAAEDRRTDLIKEVKRRYVQHLVKSHWEAAERTSTACTSARPGRRRRPER
jgi:hypothetical protein